MQEVSGSIPLTSTKFWGNMHRIGVVSVWLGILASAVGLVVGFVQLMHGDGSGYEFWLGLVPAGFILLLLGTGMTQLSNK